jgi:recombination protein RecA
VIFVVSIHYQKQWKLRALSGSLIEVSGKDATARFIMAAKLILDAQSQKETVAWIIRRGDSFFPPDLDSAGVDLDALAVIRVGDNQSMFKVADQLLRSGAFGLIILDLLEKSWTPDFVQMRLLTLAIKYGSTVLFLTTKESTTSSLGSLVSLHGHVLRKRTHAGSFTCEVRILKDKRRGPGWSHLEICYGQDGLCQYTGDPLAASIKD